VTALVGWLLQRRYRLLALAVAVTPFVQLLAVALIALDTIRRGPRQGLASALIALVGVVVLSAIVGFDTRVLGVMASTTMAAGFGLGAIVNATYSLTLAFQACVAVCAAIVMLSVWMWPDVRSTVAPQLEVVIDTLRQEGVAPEFIDAVNQAANVVFGLSAAFGLVQLFVAIVLAYWWSCLAGLPQSIGEQFRSLRMGRILGVPATLLMATSLFFDATLIQNLFPVVLVGFCIQGLAVTHAWAHARSWNPAVLLVMYVLLISPLSGLLLLALGSMGLTDSWINLRGPLRAVR
jgi:hypothetical protein